MERGNEGEARKAEPMKRGEEYQNNDEKRQVYVNNFPYATDKKNILEQLDATVKNMKASGEEIQS
eukprot:10588693-Heterocapsa_arctica.AAC.1